MNCIECNAPFDDANGNTCLPCFRRLSPRATLIDCPACKGSGREDKRDYCGARVRPHQVDCNECVGTGYYEHHLPPVRCHSYPHCGCPALELCVPYLEQALEDARAEERVKIVAWLRDLREDQLADALEARSAVNSGAVELERGDRMRQEAKDEGRTLAVGVQWQERTIAGARGVKLPFFVRCGDMVAGDVWAAKNSGCPWEVLKEEYSHPAGHTTRVRVGYAETLDEAMAAANRAVLAARVTYATTEMGALELERGDM